MAAEPPGSPGSAGSAESSAPGRAIARHQALDSGERGGSGERGAALVEAVAVMDRLRSPGGCPWDAAQTHTSLLRYLVEECYELVQAVEDGDVAGIREELGDVLLQVLFHSRIAAETPRDAGGFDLDDVAAGLVDKLIRRHPHVFGPDPDPTLTAGDQERRWDELKKAEHERPSPLDGVALGQPSLALAAKLGARSVKYGVDVPLPEGDSAAEQIFRLAFRAGAAGEDPERAVRTVARAHAARISGL